MSPSVVPTEAADRLVTAEAELLQPHMFAPMPMTITRHTYIQTYKILFTLRTSGVPLVIGIGPVSGYACEVGRPFGHRSSRPPERVVVVRLTEVLWHNFNLSTWTTHALDRGVPWTEYVTALIREVTVNGPW